MINTVSHWINVEYLRHSKNFGIFARKSHLFRKLNELVHESFNCFYIYYIMYRYIFIFPSRFVDKPVWRLMKAYDVLANMYIVFRVNMKANSILVHNYWLANANDMFRSPKKTQNICYPKPELVNWKILLISILNSHRRRLRFLNWTNTEELLSI